MAAKPFWRRISVWHVNAVVIALILVLGVAYRTELRWAARELPRYLHGEIGTPAETRMYNAAARLVYANERLELAESFLERSMAIDPYGGAVWWHAEYLRKSGRIDEALAEYRRLIDFDPTSDRPYRRIAAILASRGELEGAREILQQGLDYFSTHLDRFRPRVDPSVADRFNQKARDVHRDYLAAIDKLEDELERLAEP